jgi:hypothetical protein
MPLAGLRSRLRERLKAGPADTWHRAKRAKLVFCDLYVHETRILTELLTGRIGPYKTDNGAFAIQNSA